MSIAKTFAENDIKLTEQQISQFSTYRTLLKEWNKVMNLTAIDDDEGILQRHFIDSISLLKGVNFTSSDTVIDVGTGAGFPGLPIAIVSGCQMTLLDALNKRIQFLEAVCEEAEINNVMCLHSRAEDAGKSTEYREQFDYVVARAVANLTTLLEYTIPFLKVGGALIAHKATKTLEEIEGAQEAIEILGCKLETTRAFEDGSDRTLIIIRKVKETPNRYPRKAGIPTKRPLSYKNK